MERESVAAVKTNPSARVMAGIGPAAAGCRGAALSMAMTWRSRKKNPQGQLFIESEERISHIALAQSRTCLWASTASPKSEISGQVQTAKSRWWFRKKLRMP
jgi:hypothetical protein